MGEYERERERERGCKEKLNGRTDYRFALVHTPLDDCTSRNINKNPNGMPIFKALKTASASML